MTQLAEEHLSDTTGELELPKPKVSEVHLSDNTG